MKVEKEITTYITKWLHKNGFECNAEIGTDFSFWSDTDTISCALVINDTHMNLFQKVADELGIEYTCDNFLLSFFHELGHFETLDEINERTYKASQRKKAKLETKEVYTEKDYMTYYHLPEEIIATQWAVDFINENPNKVAKFWNGLQPLILKFYEVNNVND